MKRLLSLIIPLALALCLAACGAEEPREGWSALSIARRAASAGGLEGGFELTYGGELFEDYAGEYYGLDMPKLVSGAIIAAGGSEAGEAAALQFTDESAAAEAAQLLEDYLARRAADFEGYMPEEAELLENAAVVRKGRWCALAALPDSAAGAAAFEECFSIPGGGAAESAAGLPDETAAAETGWSYDAARILEAWRAGTTAGLAAEDLAILAECEYVLSAVAPPGMTDYERELAVHDYIIETAEYDSNRLSLLPFFEENPNNTNPYGALVDGRAVCEGYSSAFQLLMDMIGVECITVRGESNADRDPHAWNMVRLDGEWYCVDVTWDDPIVLGAVSEQAAHRYFNVTSDFMRETKHFWDGESVPEAEGTLYAWRP